MRLVRFSHPHNPSIIDRAYRMTRTFAPPCWGLQKHSSLSFRALAFFLEVDFRFPSRKENLSSDFLCFVPVSLKCRKTKEIKMFTGNILQITAVKIKIIIIIIAFNDGNKSSSIQWTRFGSFWLRLWLHLQPSTILSPGSDLKANPTVSIPPHQLGRREVQSKPPIHTA